LIVTLYVHYFLLKKSHRSFSVPMKVFIIWTYLLSQVISSKRLDDGRLEIYVDIIFLESWSVFTM